MDFRAANVNAKRLVVPLNFYEALVTEQALQPLSLLRHDLLLSQYTEETSKSAGPRTQLRRIHRETVPHQPLA